MRTGDRALGSLADRFTGKHGEVGFWIKESVIGLIAETRQPPPSQAASEIAMATRARGGRNNGDSPFINGHIGDLEMKSNTKMVLGAVFASLAMMGSVVSANDRIDFRGYTGCDRAVDGAQQALSLAFSAADLPSDDRSRDRKWRIAMEYNRACYDVVRASCGSADGFLRPPAKQSSIRLCQDLLNGGYDRAIALTTQRFSSNQVGNFHMIEATIRVGFHDAENAAVLFESACTSDQESGGCKGIGGGLVGPEIYIVNGWGSATDVASCPSSTRDFDDETMLLGELMRDIPAHRQGFLDETKLNCTFFSAQQFTVKVVPKGSTQ